MSPYFQASKNKLEETATRLPPMDTAHKHRSWAESRAFSSYHMQVESFRMDPLLLSRTGTDTRHNGCARSRSHRNCNNWFMILLAFVLVVAMAGTTHARVTLLFTNAVNGRLVDTNGVGGFARIKSVFGQYPAGSTVRINGHGFIGGGAASDIAAAGAAETDVMNTLSYHASGIGTRELGIGPASLSTNVAQRANFPLVATTWNFATRLALQAQVKPYTVASVVDSSTNQPVKVGIISIGSPYQCSIAPCSDTVGPFTSAEPPAAAIARVTTIVRQLATMEQCDLVVAIGTSADPLVDWTVVRQVTGIDVFFAGSAGQQPSVAAFGLPVSASANFPWRVANSAGVNMTVAWVPDTGGASVAAVYAENFPRTASSAVSTGALIAVSCADPSNSGTCVQPDSATQALGTAKLAAISASTAPLAVTLGSTLQRSPACQSGECALGQFVASGLASYVGMGVCQAALVSVTSLAHLDGNGAIPSSSTLTWSGLRALWPGSDQLVVASQVPADVLLDWAGTLVARARNAGDMWPQAVGLTATLAAAAAPTAPSVAYFTDISIGGLAATSAAASGATFSICTTGDTWDMLPAGLKARIGGAVTWHVDVVDAMYRAYASTASYSFASQVVWPLSSSASAAAVVGMCSVNATAALDASRAVTWTDPCAASTRAAGDMTLQLTGSTTQIAANISVVLTGLKVGDKLAVSSSPTAVAASSLTVSAAMVNSSLPYYLTAPFLPAHLRVSYTGLRSGGVGLSVAAIPLTSCPAGYYPGSPSTSCVACAAGTYRNSTNAGTSATCTSCPIGYFAPAGAATSCTPCPAGSISTADGQSSCATCPDGTFQASSGKSTCLTCTAPRTRVSPGVCTCMGDGLVFDASANACTPTGLMQSIAATSAFLAGAAALLIFATIGSVYLWSKRKRLDRHKNKKTEHAPASGNTRSNGNANSSPNHLVSGMVTSSKLDTTDSQPGEDAPIQRAIEILQMLKACTTSARLRKQIDAVMNILVQGDIFNSQIDRLVDKGDMDDDVKDWIATTVIGKRTSAASDQAQNIRAARTRTISRGAAVAAAAAIAAAGQFDAAGYVAEAPMAIEYLSRDVFRLSDMQTQRVREMAENAHHWDFDIFEFTEATNGHPLLFMSYYILKKLKLVEEVKVDEVALLQYLDEIELTYQDNPYHNAIHAADMLQAMWVFLNDTRISSACSSLELFAIVLACAMHDVDHPGVTNAFIVKSRHPLSILYSDTSVLEFHHAATGISIAEQRQLFRKMGPGQYDEARKLIIELVMATDMGKHFEFLNKFKSQLSAVSGQKEELKLDKPELKMLVLVLAMKCSDLNNPTRPRAVSLEWTTRIMEEFYQQGDQERSFGIPISKFMDRACQADENVAKCQQSFIDFIVAPLYTSWTSYLVSPANEVILKNVADNRSFWAEGSRSRDNLNVVGGAAAAGGDETRATSPGGGASSTTTQGLSSPTAIGGGSTLRSPSRSKRSYSFAAGSIASMSMYGRFQGLGPRHSPSADPMQAGQGGPRSETSASGSTATVPVSDSIASTVLRSEDSTHTSVSSVRNGGSGMYGGNFTNGSVRLRAQSEYVAGSVNALNGGGGHMHVLPPHRAGMLLIPANGGAAIRSDMQQLPNGGHINGSYSPGISIDNGPMSSNSTISTASQMSIDSIALVRRESAAASAAMAAALVAAANGGTAGGSPLSAPPPPGGVVIMTTRDGTAGGAILPSGNVRRGSASLQGLRAIPRGPSMRGDAGMPLAIPEMEEDVEGSSDMLKAGPPSGSFLSNPRKALAAAGATGTPPRSASRGVSPEGSSSLGEEPAGPSTPRRGDMRATSGI